MSFLQTAFRRAYDNPWLLIAMSCVFWAGNTIAARMAIGEISPMAMVTGRWALSCLLLLAVGRRQLVEAWPVLSPHWKKIAVMGFFGFTVFQQLYYLSAHYTTGVNLAIIQGVSPVLMLVGAWALWGARISLMQIGGFSLTMVGVALVATHGDLLALRDFNFRIGDLGVLGSAIVYAGYALSLRDRPKAPAMGFFVIMVFAGFFTSLPLFIWEALAGYAFAPTFKGWMVLIYAAIFPSLLAQLCFIRSVELIGPSRVALFYNVTPVMGAIFAVVVLSEPFELHQALALVFVIGGVIIAERLGKRP